MNDWLRPNQLFTRRELWCHGLMMRALLAAATLTAGLTAFAVRAYMFPVFWRPCKWYTVRAILLLGFVFDLLLCFLLGIQCTYARGQESQTEKEQLKGLAVQQWIDRLRQQINPHRSGNPVLFNGLSGFDVVSRCYQWVGSALPVWKTGGYGVGCVWVNIGREGRQSTGKLPRFSSF